MRYWRLILLVLIVVCLILVTFRGFKNFTPNKKINNEETETYQVLVSVYDEKKQDPIEDRKSSMKKGYVIGVYPENHEWSQTEKVSCLILKMKLNEKEAREIVEPIEKEIDKKTLTEEQREIIKKEENQEAQKEIVSARKYKVDFEKLGFSDPNSLLGGQPYGDKVFGWEIVENVK